MKGGRLNGYDKMKNGRELCGIGHSSLYNIKPYEQIIYCPYGLWSAFYLLRGEEQVRTSEEGR